CFRNQAEDMGKPSGVRNRGSGEKLNLCLKSANLNMAKKGQNGPSVRAMTMFEKGVDHLTNAIAVCGQPQQLLQVLQQTLPPPVFQMLLTKLPTISQRIISSQALSEDDVE
uniref:Translocase of outer mitochondrial membrane 20 n=1 Tax=Xiphophorus couchianus TaxID=32473 RepID=A0A3B5M8M4_9TELE